MKILKKIISLTMSAVLLFTTNSALQAAKIDTAQMQEIKELRQDIIKEVKREKLYPNLPKPEEMIATHDYAVKNVAEQIEKILAELKAKYPISKEKEEAAEGFVKEFKSALQNTTLSVYGVFRKYRGKYINAKTLELIKQVSQKIEDEASTARYKKVIKNKGERKSVAASTALYTDSLYDLIEEQNFFFQDICGGQWDTCVHLLIILRTFLTWLVGAGLIIIAEGTKYEILRLVAGITGSAVLLLGWIIFFYSIGAYTPSISPAFDEKKVFGRFTEKPFEYLADFDKKNKEFEYANVYGKSQRCAQALNDAVDIEYYVSANPNNFENAKEKLYVGTIDWYEMEPEARAEYLHNFAERLRAEAKAQIHEYKNSHSQRIGLAEK
ncbi:MAG: hypothetical protein K6E94_06485 [Elusimicrobiaceae bacterium]|nr:hypothetical protein [Elusimicrobiaceae bacterium]